MQPSSAPSAVRAPAPAGLLIDGRPARQAWPLDPAKVHLNHGSFGGVPSCVVAEQRRLADQMEAAPVSWFGELPARVAAARERIAEFLRTDDDGLALVPNASAGTTVAFNAGLLPVRGRILVTDHGYGAVTMGARRAAERVGGTVETIAIALADPAEQIVEAIGARLDGIDLLVVDQITSPTGRHLPVHELCRLARERGVLTVVDGAHAPGMVAEPVVTDADFWTGNLHKWACTPRGTGALYVHPDHRDRVAPLIDSWGAPDAYPMRFDYQGTIDLTPWLAAPAAIDFIAEKISWDELRRHNRELADWAQTLITEALSEAAGSDLSVEVAEPSDAMRLIKLPAGIGVSREDADGLRNAMAADLGLQLAFTSFEGEGYLRLSAQAYNEPADYQQFIDLGIPYLLRLAAERRPASGRAAVASPHPLSPNGSEVKEVQ